MIYLRSDVDQAKPKGFSHVSQGLVNRRKNQARKISQENQQKLKKILDIMNRKPKGNGLDGLVPYNPTTLHNTLVGPAQTDSDAQLATVEEAPKTGNMFQI